MKFTKLVKADNNSFQIKLDSIMKKLEKNMMDAYYLVDDLRIVEDGLNELFGDDAYLEELISGPDISDCRDYILQTKNTYEKLVQNLIEHKKGI